jgi:hypothetical protein
MILRVGRNLREGDVAGRVDEFSEVTIGDGRAVERESVDRHAMNRRFFGIVAIRAHAERSAGNEHHRRVRTSVAREFNRDVALVIRHVFVGTRFASSYLS